MVVGGVRRSSGFSRPWRFFGATREPPAPRGQALSFALAARGRRLSSSRDAAGIGSVLWWHGGATRAGEMFQASMHSFHFLYKLARGVWSSTHTNLRAPDKLMVRT